MKERGDGEKQRRKGVVSSRWSFEGGSSGHGEGESGRSGEAADPLLILSISLTTLCRAITRIFHFVALESFAFREPLCGCVATDLSLRKKPS